MNPRPLALGAAAVGAFLLAFAIGKATDHRTDGAPARTAVAIEPGGAVISADVTTGARLPGLKERRPPPRRPAPTPSEATPRPTPAPTAPAPPPTRRPLTPVQPRPMPSPDSGGKRPDSGEGGVIGGGVN